MAIQLLPLELSYTSGAHIYAVIHGVVSGTRQVWNPTLNTGAGGWQAYNSANWGQLAIALTEQSGSGYYAATYPVGAAGVITSEVFYNNVSPTLGDAPISSVAYTQGRNVTGFNGDPVAAANAQLTAGAEVFGTALTGATNQVIPTNLTTAQAAAAVGGSLIFSAAATGAPNCAGRVISASASTLTLAAPLPAVPANGDAFAVT